MTISSLKQSKLALLRISLQNLSPLDSSSVSIPSLNLDFQKFKTYLMRGFLLEGCLKSTSLDFLLGVATLLVSNLLKSVLLCVARRWLVSLDSMSISGMLLLFPANFDFAWKFDVLALFSGF